jgi:hypothetical protein
MDVEPTSSGRLVVSSIMRQGTLADALTRQPCSASRFAVTDGNTRSRNLTDATYKLKTRSSKLRQGCAITQLGRNCRKLIPLPRTCFSWKTPVSTFFNLMCELDCKSINHCYRISYLALLSRGRFVCLSCSLTWGWSKRTKTVCHVSLLGITNNEVILLERNGSPKNLSCFVFF